MTPPAAVAALWIEPIMRFWSRATFLAATMIFTALAVPAHASCYSDCMGRCTMIGQTDTAYCRSQSATCSTRCMFGGGDAKSYGAIAYSPSTRAYGYSFKFGSRRDAEQRARNECGKRDCEIAAWYFNSCGALAVSENGSWGASNGSSEQRARALAQARCQREGGVACKILHSACSR